MRPHTPNILCLCSSLATTALKARNHKATVDEFLLSVFFMAPPGPQVFNII